MLRKVYDWTISPFVTNSYIWVDGAETTLCLASRNNEMVPNDSICRITI